MRVREFVPREDTGLMLVDMPTRDVADRDGVNTQTLRYYEPRGLLAEPPRSPPGQQRAEPHSLGRTQRVLHPRVFGVSAAFRVTCALTPFTSSSQSGNGAYPVWVPIAGRSKSPICRCAVDGTS